MPTAKPPFSQACENNRGPILKVLQPVLANCRQLLEIGSGTGQHAAWFAPAMPHLQWQTSDLPENHWGINQWISAYPATNLRSPLSLDVLSENWPSVDNVQYDAVFTANTLHIVPWAGVVNMLAKVGSLLSRNGLLCVYGPMGYGGIISPQSNIAFDHHLRQRGSHMGIRQFEDINDLAGEAGLLLLKDYPMPANNHLLVWQKV